MTNNRSKYILFLTLANQMKKFLREFRCLYCVPGPSKEDLPSISETDNEKVEDEEYERMMSRLEELEMEELAAEDDSGNDTDNAPKRCDDGQAKDHINQFQHGTSADDDDKYMEVLFKLLLLVKGFENNINFVMIILNEQAGNSFREAS